MKGVKQMEKLVKFLKEEDGVTALEYTVLAALVIVVIVGFFDRIQGYVTDIWTAIADALAPAATP